MQIKTTGDTIRIVHLSDLHTGYDHNTFKIHKKFFKENGDCINSTCALVIAGDMISHSQHQFKTLFRNLREITSIPILVVRGNHCHWDKPTRGKIFHDYHRIINDQKELMGEYNIYHFENGPVTITSPSKTVKLWGMDGWYNNTNVQSDDRAWMRRVWNTIPPDPFEFLVSKANIDFNKILDEVETDKSDVKILVTHFPPINFLEDQEDHKYYVNQKESGGIRSFLEPITENFDYCLMGHFHSYFNVKIGKCNLRTTGCNNNKPVMNVVEL